MAIDNVSNFAKAEVDGLYSSSAVSIDLETSGGSEFNTDVNAVWWNSTDYPDPSDDPSVEIVRITNISTDTLTITRGQEGTSAVNHNTSGKTYKLVLALTKKTIDDIKTFINQDVTTTGTPTFANLTSPGSSRVGNHLFAGTSAELNYYGTGDRVSYIDFHSDDTYSDYGIRLVKYPGENGVGEMVLRGTGGFNIKTLEVAPINFYTNSIKRLNIDGDGTHNLSDLLYVDKPTGMVGLGISIPVRNFDITGSSSADFIGQRIANSNTTDGRTATLEFALSDSVGTIKPSALITSGGNINITTSYLVFHTLTSNYTMEEKMRVTSNGNLLLGITTGSDLLTVAGTAGYNATTDMGATDTDFASKKYVDDNSGGSATYGALSVNASAGSQTVGTSWLTADPFTVSIGSNGTSIDTINKRIRIDTAGTYRVSYTVSGTTNNDTFFGIDNTGSTGVSYGQANVEYTGTGYFNASGQVVGSFAANDYVKVIVKSAAAGTSVNTDYGTLIVERLT